MRAATLDALVSLTEEPRAALEDRLHERAMGSFLRGATDSGDIDFIIAPPPVAGVHVYA